MSCTLLLSLPDDTDVRKIFADPVLDCFPAETDNYSCFVEARVLHGRKPEVALKLEEAGIPTGYHYKPNHLLTLFGGGNERLPNSEQLGEELLTVPLHPALNDEDIEFICSSLIAALR